MNYEVPAIKNEDTERFCQEVAREYKNSKSKANDMFKEYYTLNRPVYWECLAIQDRISYLIKKDAVQR